MLDLAGESIIASSFYASFPGLQRRAGARMKDVNDLLDSLRTHGTIDSEGTFTVSLSQARRKLTQYQSSDASRFLLHLVSGGIAAGAAEVSITRQDLVYEISFVHAYLTEEELLKAFNGEASSSGATDMVLGLRGSFSHKALRVELRVQHPQKRNYLWEMDKSGENTAPLAPAPTQTMDLRIEFGQSLVQKVKSIFSRWRGYVGMPPEERLVDMYCDRSLVPIRLNDQAIHRPILMTPSRFYALVGELGASTPMLEPKISIPGRPWKGALSLVPGRVQIVIFGVAYCQIEDSGLSGTVYHDELKRDISGERVVQDRGYNDLVRDLEKIRCRLLLALAENLDGVSDDSHDMYLTDLVVMFLTRRLSSEARKSVWEWMLRRLPRLAPAQAETQFPPTNEGLMALYEVLEPKPDSQEMVLKELLKFCSQGLRERRASLSSILTTTNRLFLQHDPQSVLIQGYLLLGIGAIYHTQNRKKEGDAAWFEALKVVWSGHDDRAQELIYLHMEFGVKHMLDQVATALEMYLGPEPTFVEQSASPISA